MTAKKKKVDSKTVAAQKRSHRRLLSIYRVCRYGLESFIRNSWLSIAATAVMTITLLIIFTAFISQNILSSTVSDLREKVDMSIYLKTDTTDEDGKKLINDIEKLASVRSASYVSSAKAKELITKENIDDPSILEAIREATNKTPATIKVVMNDINNTSELEKFVNNNANLKKHINPDYKPSFAGERRNTIKSIGRAVGFAQEAGVIAGSIFVTISSLIIFNTIRMAIFNRREEIQMMKLIGADQSFIRGPFLIEAIFYGVIAAIIATALGILALFNISSSLKSYQISVQPAIDLITKNAVLTVIGMILIGALIGIISSLLATRRYLKI